MELPTGSAPKAGPSHIGHRLTAEAQQAERTIAGKMVWDIHIHWLIEKPHVSVHRHFWSEQLDVAWDER